MSADRAPAVAASAPHPPRRRRRLNLTGLQFLLFGATALFGVAALTAAGVALGLAMAGAGVVAAVLLGAWIIGANLLGLERRR